ncbi:RNHCP domain protein [Streptomyces sp. S4.7]|uniref:RNHCP domain-containing protein n=1 Tax=Streptomyces sp. S4.7 TaxID=2705439 RepID=UPI001398BAFB|nr:RNHCP domain-containing protein [Streptomyces sp. S4.7]QHY99929.1 RNHCP domain protein [Streptomyces sp. S4.7]
MARDNTSRTRRSGSRNTSRRARTEARAESFRCLQCGLDVPMSAPGTDHRNHCPNCLWSRRLDDTPGDRQADYGARMEPLAISVRGDGEWVLVHRCTHCEVIHANRTAGDDNALPLIRLAVRPLAQPPFPFERLSGL